MSGHTNGPWAVDGSHIYAPDGEIIARVHNPGRRASDYPLEANRDLMAAAPELLEACRTFAEWLRREDEGLPGGIERGTPEGERRWREWWNENLRICALAQDQARAAIAKATGANP